MLRGLFFSWTQCSSQYERLHLKTVTHIRLNKWLVTMQKDCQSKQPTDVNDQLCCLLLLLS